MARILFLAHRVPFPPNKGDKIRAFHELKHLAQKHEIWLGAPADDPADLAHLDEAKRDFRDAYFGPVGLWQTGVNLAGAALNGAPLSVKRFYHPGLRHWCDRILKEIEPDLVFVFSSAAAQFVLGRLPERTKLITDFVDADAEKWRAYEAASQGPKRALYGTEFRRLVRYESRVAAHSAANLFVSETERKIFSRLVPEATALHVVPNGVDTDHFQPQAAFGAAQPGSIVFSGTMDYRPNIEAVSWFANDILPLIRRHIPGARLNIVGAKPAPSVLALATLPGVAVAGSVPDMRPWLQQAAVIVTPLKIARGIQNKVLEGMAMARPVVTTPEALDGITARPGQDLLVASSATEFANQVVAVLERRAREDLGANARAAVIAHHGWAHHLDGLDRLIARLLH
ncbi:MAG TPA: TIGR03087 family PEP-CTERM/XrtA system glycosyltransferase [Rhizomicrobium sp.]